MVDSAYTSHPQINPVAPSAPVKPKREGNMFSNAASSVASNLSSAFRAVAPSRAGPTQGGKKRRGTRKRTRRSKKGSRSKKGMASKTRKGRKDYVTHKGNKFYNRKGKRQSRNRKGRKGKPYSRSRK